MRHSPTELRAAFWDVPECVCTSVPHSGLRYVASGLQLLVGICGVRPQCVALIVAWGGLHSTGVGP